jgi:hypothetical protein
VRVSERDLEDERVLVREGLAEGVGVEVCDGVGLGVRVLEPEGVGLLLRVPDLDLLRVRVGGRLFVRDLLGLRLSEIDFEADGVRLLEGDVVGGGVCDLEGEGRRAVLDFVLECVGRRLGLFVLERDLLLDLVLVAEGFLVMEGVPVGDTAGVLVADRVRLLDLDFVREREILWLFVLVLDLEIRLDLVLVLEDEGRIGL